MLSSSRRRQISTSPPSSRGSTVKSQARLRADLVCSSARRTSRSAGSPGGTYVMSTSAEPPQTISSSLVRSSPARRRSTMRLTRVLSTSAAARIIVSSSRPPPMVPAMEPSRRTSISAPAARGVDPRSPTSLTRAKSSPSSSSARASLRISFTSTPPGCRAIVQASASPYRRPAATAQYSRGCRDAAHGP